MKVVVYNQQVYHLQKRTIDLDGAPSQLHPLPNPAACLLGCKTQHCGWCSLTNPACTVSTYVTLNDKNQVLRHEDVWNNAWGVPGIFKKPNGMLSSSIFKLLGWGKQIDNTKA